MIRELSKVSAIASNLSGSIEQPGMIEGDFLDPGC